MVYASVRSGPSGGSRLVSADEKAAGALRGVGKVIQEERWIAVVGESWWAANRALNVLKPRFETRGRLADSAAISKALQNAFDDGPSADAANTGDVEKLLGGKNVISASYDVPMLAHGSPETPGATVRIAGDRCEHWGSEERRACREWVRTVRYRWGAYQ